MSSLGFIRTLLRQYRGMMVLILLAGTLSGLFSAAVVAVINELLRPDEDRVALLAVGFAGLVAGKVLTNLFSQLWLVRFAQDAIIEITVTLCRNILGSPLRTIEQAGSDQILTTLTDDVGSVVWSAQCVPNLAMNGAVIAGCGVYLLWLSPSAFAGVVIVVSMGAAGYYWLHRRSFPAIAAAREAKAQTFYQFRGLTEGIKELLMNAAMGRRYLAEEIRQSIAMLRRCNLEAFRHHLIGESWTQSLYYFLIGLLLLVMPRMLELTEVSLTGFVFAILYLMNPVWAVIGSLPVVARGNVALARIHDLGMTLEAGYSTGISGEAVTDPLALPVEISMDRVVFSYHRVGEDTQVFGLGPIDFSLRAGELVFIVGGNGSGKSTFVKLLTGLYPPHSGTIRMGDTLVVEENRDWYRQHFSVVFSDYHLFERLYGGQGQEVESKVRQYLKLLEVDDKVSFAQGRFSTLNLSQGQRRRLALIAAYVDDRPIFVFDEWAADQDPHYKGVFYNRLLPDLCERGKAVVVITHDDRYFHLGDRVVKLEDGKILESWTPRAGRAANDRS